MLVPRELQQKSFPKGHRVNDKAPDPSMLCDKTLLWAQGTEVGTTGPPAPGPVTGLRQTSVQQMVMSAGRADEPGQRLEMPGAGAGGGPRETLTRSAKVTPEQRPQG